MSIEPVTRARMTQVLWHDMDRGGFSAALANDVLRVHPIMRGDTPVRLNDDQQRAVALALLRNFVVISGGPGTGKTSIGESIARATGREVRSIIVPSSR